MPQTISHVTKHVPADIDAGSLGDLIADCQDMCAGALPAAKVIDLTRSMPMPRVPEMSRSTVIDIRDSVVSLVDGLGDYGA